MSAENYSHLACPNPDCQAYGRRGGGNLRPHGWSGRGHRIRCLHCVQCGTDFSQRANTPLFGLRTSEDTLACIARHLADGTGVRATGRLCGVSLNTVLRFTKRFGHHAEKSGPRCPTQADSAGRSLVLRGEKKTSTVMPWTPPMPSRAVTGTT